MDWIVKVPGSPIPAACWAGLIVTEKMPIGSNHIGIIPTHATCHSGTWGLLCAGTRTPNFTGVRSETSLMG